MRKKELTGRGLKLAPLTLLFIVFSIFMSAGCGSYPSQVYADIGVEGSTDDVTYLAQYGTWTDVAPYGSVWVPSVSSDWRPFVYGHWEWTDAGWAWVSYEPYGWLVYHYGNWDYAADIGWFWIEGNEWSPAPVEWLNFEDFCAWAPLPPAGVEWHDPWYKEGPDCWVMVRDRDFDRENIGQYQINVPPRPEYREFENISHRPIGVDVIERYTRRKIEPQLLKHGPVQVFMNPHREERHPEMQPGATQVRHEPMNQHAGNVHVEAPETRPSHVEHRPAENQERAVQPSAGQQEMNRRENGDRIQLHRMILPKNDYKRVQRYAPRVERDVLIHKQGEGTGRSFHKGEERGRKR
jgi:hypothetical protein